MAKRKFEVGDLVRATDKCPYGFKGSRRVTSVHWDRQRLMYQVRGFSYYARELEKVEEK